jgi:hypothetical protein
MEYSHVSEHLALQDLDPEYAEKSPLTDITYFWSPLDSGFRKLRIRHTFMHAKGQTVRSQVPDLVLQRPQQQVKAGSN